ncbi:MULTISPECIES: conjugal transfer protein TraH [spotted fever group]|uniref:Conjugal transfer pilus assembly protein TraH n=1 Tax=Rickettsia tamurae subsp. buchneri TaxID=1462938 RepID=A0A8E1C0B0_9RICK|nr:MULTISPECIES: conjugal transfer protein TraH [spotted fever group]EER22294.1 F pilus assembly protein TraH [Rickettsia endosymbiont of Ixodes scapularis]KDO02765.1 conjugal transfer pilus assembly protein TraH [Rickettsia tamurae subsp. buchneri]KDO03394.1 conjugal transfer pilus assembly protein TraH [Rickettsia tamurae subsp. buchneri]
MNSKIHSTSSKIYLTIIVIIWLIQLPTSFAWNINDVFQGMSTNVTKPGSYQDQAAGYYAAGGLSMRTSKTSFNPISMTAPSLTMSCSGIDAYLGSFSIISGEELVQLMKNIGSQAKAYAFSLGLKTFAPQIENALKDLRNLAMELNQFAKGDCEMTKAIFASVLPKDSAMRESVCRDLQLGSGMDYFSASKKCRNDLEQKQALQQAQNKDPEMMLGDYNIFTKAAEKAGIPLDMRNSIMSMIGTIIVKDHNVYFFDSLAKDEKSWITHLKGGESASVYACDDSSCLNPSLRRNISILPEQSYQGKAKTKLDELKSKLASNNEFNNMDIAFLSSIGEAFPIYDYITLEAISGVTILDSSSELIASYTLLQHLKEVISEVRKAVTLLKSKQVSDQHLVAYLKALDRVQIFATEKWSTMLTNADQIDRRARLIEQHIMAKERS